ncbi:glycosyltransferase [Persicitalea jodogahamensis]|uniref:Glycosyl transferase n=1 Tax=Persicitalea jodogahamensis TaxID=402147 RepID=A0A8J3DB32_9BACT|nr:glycosyltransferase [Persicitalea jodogahamensis]GHB78007.1 glycosyl transferase [Persicitalea jodogahamensis]
MKILIVHKAVIPVHLYGGIERVIWDLGRELVRLGHQVVYLVKSGSHCEFAEVLPIDDAIDITAQIPEAIDLVHFHFAPKNIDRVRKPYLITIHENIITSKPFDLNTVFISRNHAERHGSSAFVYNGLDWNQYSKPNFNRKRDYFHFLGKAAWRVKNVKGAIDIIKQTKSEKLKVLGGKRFNIKMGLRLTFSPRISFYGMVGGREKNELLNGSKGLIFPVRWHEPFGLAIIESLYFGCPVFGTPYGALPEIVGSEFGELSNKANDLVAAIEASGSYNAKHCHEYASTTFNSNQMTLAYLAKYEQVLSGKNINKVPPVLENLPKETFLEWH